ncbi:MAG: glycosyltransferase family 4 protein [Lachnospiraceae bacterium]|nr:glycosyltransferase family 4 protein [Lachnospiraceae bacterium]
MQITFVSNYINHHQTPVSDELYKLTGGAYTFVQTEPMEEERINMGWDKSAAERPYVKLYYEDRKACDDLIMSSDCVIFGGCEDESIIMPRLEAGLFTVRYSESIYKSGRWKFVSPRGLKRKFHDHIRFNKAPVYMLCSGAHVAGDFRLIHAYKGKLLKYGYFPAFVEYRDLHEFRQESDTLNILWAGRFVDFKHPERVILLCRKAKEAGVKAKVTVIGNGAFYDTCVKLAGDYGVTDIVSFEGSKKPDEVREYMRRADVFISTSDKGEGWGVVINEAMNSGCVTIGTYEMGSAPYLIKNGENGYLYHAKDMDSLAKIVKDIAGDRGKRLTMGVKAYETIKELWSPQIAAKRLYAFITDNNHDMNRYTEGPLSRA